MPVLDVVKILVLGVIGLEGSDVVKILGLGVIGLGFLLALLTFYLISKIQNQPNPNNAVLRAIYCFMGFSIALCGIGFASQILDQHEEVKKRDEQIKERDEQIKRFVNTPVIMLRVSGTIDSPVPGSPVESTFQCKGTTKDLPPEGVHMWIAVMSGGLTWPKGNELSVKEDGTWFSQVSHESKDVSGSKFSLILIAADDVAHNEIEKWIDICQKTGSFEGMKYSYGVHFTKYRVDNLRLQNTP